MSAASMGENPLSTCPVGFIPPECIHECHDGYYGINCMSLCSASCLNVSCRPQNGDCYRCQVGFFGPMCSEKCKPGFHGLNCTLTCPVNCLNRLCDPFSGYCLDCIDGYGGSRCENVKRLQALVAPAKQVSPAENNDHTVLYISIIVVTITLPVCTVSLWVCILKKKFKDVYYKNYSERAAPIYRNTNYDLPFMEANFGDSNDMLKTKMKQMKAKSGANPVGSSNKRPQMQAPRPRDKSELRKHADAEGANLAAQAFSPEENMDDYKQLLKRNNSVQLSQAANYSDNLYFKTPNPDLKPALESPGENDQSQSSPEPGEQESKACINEANDSCTKAANVDAGNMSVAAGNHVSEQKLQAYQYGVHSNQHNVAERSAREAVLPPPYTGISSRNLKEMRSSEKWTNVCDADLIQHVSLPQKISRSGFKKFRKFFSMIKSLGSRNKRRDDVPKVRSPNVQPGEINLVVRPVVQVDHWSRVNRDVHRVRSCPVIVSHDLTKHLPVSLTHTTQSVPEIKQHYEDLGNGNGSQANKTPIRTKISRRGSEIPKCNVNILSQSEAFTKTTVQRLVPWPNDQTYSQKPNYVDVRLSNRQNPPITAWPLTSYFYASHCIESAGGTTVSRCPTPVLCETIDVLNSTVNSQVCDSPQCKNPANVSDDQPSTPFLSLRDSPKSTLQQRVYDKFSPSASLEQQSANMHSFDGKSPTEDDRNEDSKVCVNDCGVPTRCQKRSTQTRLTGAKHPSQIGKAGTSMQRKNVRTRMSRMISRDEVSPVLYRSPCYSPGLVLNKSESYHKCTPVGNVQHLTDQHARFMHVAPMCDSAQSRESYYSKESVAIRRGRENEVNEQHNMRNDPSLRYHADAMSVLCGRAEKTPEHGTLYDTTIQSSGRSSVDFSGILKEADRRGREVVNKEMLKRREGKPPKGMAQRTDRGYRKNHDTPIDQRQFVQSPDRRSGYIPSQGNTPLNISRNNAPTICCQESTNSSNITQEALGNTTTSYLTINNSSPRPPEENFAHTTVIMSPNRLAGGLEGAYNRSVSNNTLGPTDPRDSDIYQDLEKKMNSLRESRAHMRHAGESAMPDSLVSASEVTDSKETYAEAFSLQVAQRFEPRDCCARFSGCETDFFLTNPHTFSHASPCSLSGCELPRNQNNVFVVPDEAKCRSPTQGYADYKDLTYNAVNTCARLATCRETPVLFHNPQSPRLAKIDPYSRDTDTRHSRKTRLSFPLYDISRVDDKENNSGPLCKKLSSEEDSCIVMCKEYDLNPFVRINRVVISKPSTSSDSSSGESGPVGGVSTCLEDRQDNVALDDMRVSLQALRRPGNPIRNNFNSDELYRTKDDTSLSLCSSRVREIDRKSVTQSSTNIRFVLKSPSSRKCPQQIRSGRANRSESPGKTPQYPMPSLLETVVQTDDNLFDKNRRCALEHRSDYVAEPGIKETAALIYNAMVPECHSCPLFSRSLNFPTCLGSTKQKVVLVDHGVNTVLKQVTVEAGCQCMEPILKADKSCLASKRSIKRDLRPEERTEYRSIIEGDSEFFYDAMDYRDFESNTSKDLTLTKSTLMEPADSTEMNIQKQKRRRLLLVDLMNGYQRSRCHLSKVDIASASCGAKTRSKLIKQSHIAGASQVIHDTDPHKTSGTEARLTRPKKKFALILAPLSKQAKNGSGERRIKAWMPRTDLNSCKRSSKRGSSKHGPTGLTILACSWQAKKGVQKADAERIDGSEGSSTWTATGGNPEPVAPKRADRRHGIPPRSEVFFDVS